MASSLTSLLSKTFNKDGDKTIKPLSEFSAEIKKLTYKDKVELGILFCKEKYADQVEIAAQKDDSGVEKPTLFVDAQGPVKAS